ncbi:thyroglobulin [Nelusetta ayraudi]|uniref:thyroglobulin n=1 Tax=Nelusetta ayraudi TaxID=303726 RepID=UPI003F728CFE
MEALHRVTWIAWILLTFLESLQGRASDYQLDLQKSSCELLRDSAGNLNEVPQCSEDGRFRPAQCSGRSQECWCVDAKGQEIAGTRTNDSAPYCASPCQLQSVLRCSPSGLFEEVQCDSSRGQCWCVDQDGMELYGTRQRGTRPRCPGRCELRERLLLHANLSHTPPQCDGDGGFLPVQCVFIDTTDQSQLDLLHTFNRFPEAFGTFSQFRKFFPAVSSYCFCSDSRGRELPDTGVELFLSDIYDTAFPAGGSAASFAKTNIYRVLQRRMLGVRLAVTGHFRCPSACEEERRAAISSSATFVPYCEAGGAFSPRQCQQGGQCWCVEPSGREVPGTRQHGDQLECSSGLVDCQSQRRLALSRFFSGPMVPPPLASSGRSSASCDSFLQPLEDLLPVEENRFSVLSLLMDVLQGLFPSVGGAMQALTHFAPRRLQENLFGGKFLQNAASLNLSGAVGSRGVLVLERFSPQDATISRNQVLLHFVSRALEEPTFLSGLQNFLQGRSDSQNLQQVFITLLASCSGHHGGTEMFVPRCASGGSFQPVQCGRGQCWCVDPQGRELVGSRTTGHLRRCPSRCEVQRAEALNVKARLAAGAEVHVPVCSAAGDFLPLQCVASRCFCVDLEGRSTTAAPAGGALSCPGEETSPPTGGQRNTQSLIQEVEQEVGGASNPIKSLSIHARCSDTLAEVTTLQQELRTAVSLQNSSHMQLGYGFLLARGLHLNPEELLVSQSEGEQQASERLLTGSQAALRLAALSALQMFVRPQLLNYQPFTPQCDTDGHWLHTQCHPSTGQCWCVDEDGQYISGSLTTRSPRLPSCATRCQRAQDHTLLSGWLKGSDIITSIYKPKCEEDGLFSVLQTETEQTGGAVGWCVNPLTGEPIRRAVLDPAGQLTCPSWCELQGLQCHPDGSFLPLQCDVTSCWCVSESGQEVGGTRVSRLAGQSPSCDRPRCPAPTITHGALVCRPAADGHQSCELSCSPGYHNALPVSSFLCETKSQRWVNSPVGGACQIPQPPQLLSSSQLWLLSSSCSHISSLQSELLEAMTSRGLCSLQLPVSQRWLWLCDGSAVQLQCDGDDSLRLTVTWSLHLSNLTTSDLPHLHDVGRLLNQSRLQQRLQGILGNLGSTTSQPSLLSMTSPSLGCSPGYRPHGGGCIACPAGTLSKEGACHLCPEGTYQDAEGRDFCNMCPRGSSPRGSSSANQCETDCQRRGLRCSEQGDFLPAQPDFLSSRWRCFSREEAELVWTFSNKPLSDDECAVLAGFEAVPTSQLIVAANDTEVLQTVTSDITSCARACAAESSCHHVALVSSQGLCELYSSHTLNTQCNTSQQTRGFLGNPQAEVFDRLSCRTKVRGGASDLLVIRKKGAQFSWRQQQRSFERARMTKAVSGVFRTQVFSSTGSSLSDVHRFCQDGCSRDACCHGFILNQNSLSGGTLLCGWLRAPSVLTCGERDWDVTGQGKANRICGAGLSYNQQQKSFVFNFGGQKFTITDAELPADSKDRKDYQASIVNFQAIFLNTDADAVVGASSACAAAEDIAPPPDVSVQQRFEVLSEEDVTVDPQLKLASLSFWLNKKNFDSQQALLWCLSRCDEEPRCSVADLRDAEAPPFFSCRLHPDSRVCGAYDKPLRQACRHLLDRLPGFTYSRKVDLSGSVQSFYNRVPFQKMVAYSVRSRVSLTGSTLPAGFRECERRCDQDRCCRGFGFVRDSAELLCVSLISLGVQTCSQDVVTSWRSHECSASGVGSSPEPLGWYQKPVSQWSTDTTLCPPFELPRPALPVSLGGWSLLSPSSVHADPSLSTYDVIHVSQDIASDPDRTRDWCLSACQGVESCTAVALSEVESATRCVLYPDTTVCGLSSSPSSPSPTSSCRLVIKEPAPQVYLRTGRPLAPTSVSLPGQGTLQGIARDTPLSSDRKRVAHFLGVPYARPPIGSLRFEAAQPAEWTGTWDATKPRWSCVQPGDSESSASSEDCLYLNIFTPSPQTGRLPVLVFFFNAPANQSPGLLDGSTLAAVGNLVVVTASYRTAALGFLSTGPSGLQGNYGLSDQEAVLRWVHDHIHLVGGDRQRVTVGAERQGADIASLHLISAISPPLFQRMILMGGSIFSPSLLQTGSTSRQQALQLATELGCVTSDPTDDDKMVSCLRATPVHQLNAAQTKLLAVSGPFQSWSPVHPAVPPSSFLRVDLLLGTSHHDGLISRARRIKDFEALQGRADGKTVFYEALSRSLGGATGSDLLKGAAAWFYSLDHSPSAAGYNLFSRALNNATRDLFIICPSLQMASHWANSRANVFLYHQPADSGGSRADPSVPLDLQLAFGTPYRPISSQRFTAADRRLSLAMMTYLSSFVRIGNPNPVHLWAEAALPPWQQVLSSGAPPTYLELDPALRQQQGLSRSSCSFWEQLGPRLGGVGSGAEPALTPDVPVAASLVQSQAEKDSYS